MISFTTLMFCLSMTVVNTVEDNYLTDKSRPLYAWTGDPYKTLDDLPAASDDEFSDTLDELTTPDQNPTSFITDIWAPFSFLLDGVKFLVNTLINSTVGFGSFIQTLGCSDCGVEYVSDGVATIINVLVNMNHLLAIFQIVSGKNLRDGI
jgi:hypothetical protein